MKSVEARDARIKKVREVQRRLRRRKDYPPFLFHPFVRIFLQVFNLEFNMCIFVGGICATICKISHSCPVARADICLLMAKCHVTGVHLYIAYKL